MDQVLGARDPERQNWTYGLFQNLKATSSFPSPPNLVQQGWGWGLRMKATSS